MAQLGTSGEPAVLRMLSAPWHPAGLPWMGGNVIRLERKLTALGRSPDCDVLLPTHSISRIHCVIGREGQTYSLEDRQSRNGTYLNLQRVMGVVVLRPGDRIQIQDVVLSFERPFDESLRAWDGATLVRLAQAAYGEVLDDGSLDPIRLAILADALTDVGADEEFVTHLRGPGPHYGGCWAMEAILVAESLLHCHVSADQLARQKRSPSGCWAVAVSGAT